VPDRFWVGGTSTSFNDSANWSTGSGGSGGASIPTDSDTAIYDANSSADCVLDIDRTLNILKVESGFTRVITSSSTKTITIQQHMEINRASCFAFTSGNIITFDFDKSESAVSAFDGAGSSFGSGDIFVKYGANASVFADSTARSNCIYHFSANQDVVLVDGVYPNTIIGGILFAKYITADSSATDFNTYGSVDILQYRTNGTGTVRSTSHDIHDYDKEFFFESIHSSGIGEFFQFGHTTARFKSGSANFRLPVFGDVYTNFGNNTTNTFNVQYHKIVIEAGDDSTYYCYIQPGKTLECNELVIRDGGRLYGPAEGNQVASAKIKSVKRPTVQGDWNFKQIADGIYESINNIPTLPVTEGGTGLNTVAVNSLLIGQGQLPLSTLAMGTAGQVLKVNSGGTALEFGAASGGGGVSLSGSTNDQLVTVTGSNAIQGESNLTLSSAGDLALSGTMTMTDTAADNTTPVLTVEQNRTDNNAMLAKFIGNGNEVLHVKNSGRLHWELSTSGGASDEVIMTYNDTAGNERNFMQIDQGTVVLNNRGPNGDVEIRANTSTAGSSGEVSVANFQDDRVILNQNVGIGTSSPQANLHISSGTSGDAVLILEADTDNNNEADQPFIVFEQDGGVQHSAIGSFSGANTDNNALIFSNSVSSSGIEAGMIFKTGTSSGYANAVERMRILPAGGIKFNNAYTFPTSDGGANATLTTDGSGSLAFRDMTYHRKPAVFMDNNTQSITVSPATVGFNTEILDPASNAALTSTDGHIRIAAAGYYRISYTIPINEITINTPSQDRTMVFCIMQTDDNDSFSSPTLVNQSRAQVYTREASGGSGLSTSFIYQHTANDYIRLRIGLEQTLQLQFEPNTAQISIEYIGPA